MPAKMIGGEERRHELEPIPRDRLAGRGRHGFDSLTLCNREPILA